MHPAKKGFWDHFTVREDRLITDGFIVAVLGGLALASAVFLALRSSAAAQHVYLDTFFWIVAGAPPLAFFLVVLSIWLRRRKGWYPVPGS